MEVEILRKGNYTEYSKKQKKDAFAQVSACQSLGGRPATGKHIYFRGQTAHFDVSLRRSHLSILPFRFKVI